MRITIATLLVVTLSTNSASALAVRGSGVRSCGTWTADHQADNISASAEDLWLMGYVTAYNRWAFKGADIGGGLDAKGLTGAVTQYCASHPLDTVEVAAEDLIIQLVARDVTH